MTDVLNGLRHSEHYRYDSQLNLTQKAQRETDALGQYQFEAANDASFGMKQRNGRITRFGNKTYKYDELGRLHSKTETKKGFRPVTTYYKWNSQSQLVELHSPFKGSWRYEYDSFGRRITKYQIQTDQPQPNQVINMPIRANQDYWHKINELWAKEEQSQGEKTSQNLTALSGYRYLYKQNQLVAEAPLQITSAEGNLALTQANWADAIYWLYQEDDFTPTARYEKGQLHYTVADQVGTITELLTEDGYIDYRQKLNLWGEAEIDGHRHYAANDSNPLKCNHRFVGQYYDDESELHYNRFRYYSPETGQYISHDPIGLLGGFNPYGYVFNPSGWVDFFGLAKCPQIMRNKNGDLISAKATVTPDDIGEGTAVSQKARNETYRLDGDDTGHILAKILGGTGSDTDNLFGQNKTVNRGEYRAFEASIRRRVETTGKPVNLEWEFETYSGSKGRPDRVLYKVYQDGKLVDRQWFENPFGG